MVYVLSQEGKPLMPTTRYGHIRHLLKTGRAKVKCQNPFTIQLCYETEDKVQPVILGIDPGRTNIGLCAVANDGTALFVAKIITRNKDIPKLMQKRKQFRQKHRQTKRRLKRRRRAKKHNTVLKDGVLQRRLPGYGKDKCVTVHDIRNKQARFSNRRRGPNWLTPTANQLLQTHINAVNKISKFLPISSISIELNKFAMMKLDDPTISGKDFQNGPLKGYADNIHWAVSDMQGGKCLLCGKPIDEYHHVRTRSKNGSDTIGNLVGLCHECHKKVHTDKSTKQRLSAVNSGFRKKYDALGVLNQILPYVINILRSKYPLHITTRYGIKNPKNPYFQGFWWFPYMFFPYIFPLQIQNTLYKAFHLGGAFLLKLLGKMGVPIQRKGGSRMTQIALNGFNVISGPNRVYGICMAAVVEPCTLQSSSGNGDRKPC